MSFGFDPEVPAGFQDADIEMAEMERDAVEWEADRLADIDDLAAIWLKREKWAGVPATEVWDAAAAEIDRRNARR